MASGSNHWIQVIVNQVKTYGLIVKDKVFFLFVIAGILLGQTYMQLDMLIPVYMKDVIDEQVLGNLFNREWSVTGEGSFGILLSENGLLVVLFTVFVTRWMTKYPEKWVFFLILVLIRSGYAYIPDDSELLGFPNCDGNLYFRRISNSWITGKLCV